MKPQYDVRETSSTGGSAACLVTASTTRTLRPAFAARCSSVRPLPTGNVSHGCQSSVTRTAPTPSVR
jgi:hypothetical protein